MYYGGQRTEGKALCAALGGRSAVPRWNRRNGCIPQGKLEAVSKRINITAKSAKGKEQKASELKAEGSKQGTTFPGLRNRPHIGPAFC